MIKDKQNTLSPYQMMRSKSDVRNKKHPVAIEVAKNAATLNLTLEVREDTETLNLLNQPGAVAYLATVKQGAVVLGQGRGLVIINGNNKWITRCVRGAFSASIIDGIVKSVKVLDAIKDCEKAIDPVVNKGSEDEPDLEGRDKVCSFEDDGTLRHASEKQKAFLKSLIETKCDQSAKADYLSQLNEKYLSSFQASELISSLLPIK